MINENHFLLDNLNEAPVKAMRDGYGEGIVQAAAKNDLVVAVVADLLDSLRLGEFKKQYPERLFEVGIAEQNMMGVAAGMALTGKIPFVNSYASFNPGRNWEQLRVSVCLTKNNVKVIGGHAGFGNGVDGTNQQSFEDMALARVLPNLTVIAPVDSEQARKATLAIAEFDGPVYIRITKPARAVITNRATPFEIGKAQKIMNGSDVTIFACGSGVYEALLAADELRGIISVEVINVHTIKPIDKDTIITSARKTKRVVTVEEHSVIGGLGGAVAEVLSENQPTRMIRVGMQDTFGESGEPENLMIKYGINKEAIIAAIRKIRTLV